MAKNNTLKMKERERKRGKRRKHTTRRRNEIY
jgi:hypothetical protein